MQVSLYGAVGVLNGVESRGGRATVASTTGAGVFTQGPRELSRYARAVRRVEKVVGRAAIFYKPKDEVVALGGQRGGTGVIVTGGERALITPNRVGAVYL